jgi:hypothetical protein
MRNVHDVNGLEMNRGDMVAPITGDFKGRVCDVRSEDGVGFVCVRASHRPYSRGVWYASDHVQRLALARVKKKPGDAPKPMVKRMKYKARVEMQ